MTVSSRPRRARALRRLALSGTAAAAVLAGAALQPAPATAESLQEALANAYRSNPNLEAARRGLGATNEAVPQAKSGWRPSVTVRGQAGRQRTDSEPTGTQPLTGQTFGGVNYTTPLSTSL